MSINNYQNRLPCDFHVDGKKHCEAELVFLLPGLSGAFQVGGDGQQYLIKQCKLLLTTPYNFGVGSDHEYKAVNESGHSLRIKPFESSADGLTLFADL